MSVKGRIEDDSIVRLELTMILFTFLSYMLFLYIFFGGGGNVDVEQALHDEAWLTWADQKLVKLLPVNIYRNFSEAFEAFEYIGKVGQWSFLRRHALRYTGAFAMRMLHDKLRTRAGLEKGADEREALFAQLELWADAIGQYVSSFVHHICIRPSSKYVPCFSPCIFRFVCLILSSFLFFSSFATNFKD